MSPEVIAIGDTVRIKSDDTVYPNAKATIAKVDTREGKPYLGLAIEVYADHFIDHIVWRYADQVEA